MLKILFKTIPRSACFSNVFKLHTRYPLNKALFSSQKQDVNKKTGGNTQASQLKQSESDNHRNVNVTNLLQILKKIAFLMCVGAIGGFLGYVVFGQDEQNTTSGNLKSQLQQNQKSNVKLGGKWKLLSTESKTFTSDDLAGSYYLIYFGYALCPDICPTTLNYLANVHRHLNNLEEAKKLKLKILFVSVDPKRDSPLSIQKYVDLFDHSIIGLTGKDQNDEDFKSMLNHFKVYANKIKIGEGDGYNIDHTSIVFLMDSNNQFIGSINTSKSEKQTAKFIIQKINNHEETLVSNDSG